MAFSRLRTLLERKSADVPALDQLQKQKTATRIWEDKGVILFSKDMQEHLKKNIRIISIRNNQVTIQVPDTKTATLILMQRQRLEKLFSTDEEPAKRLIVRQS